MKRYSVFTGFASCVVVCSASSVSTAQPFYLAVEGLGPLGPSTNGEITVQPGDTICVWTEPLYVPGGCPPPNGSGRGFRAITSQTVLQGMLPGDSIVPFEPSIGVLPNGIGGRVIPYAVPDHSVGSAPGPVIVHFDPDGTRRIAGANCVTPTTNLAWGVNLLRTTPRTEFEPAPCTKLYYIATDASVLFSRTIQVSEPAALIFNGQLSWYVDAADNFCTINVGPTNVRGLTIHIRTNCDDIDFNNNDVFPEDQDVIDFFNVLAGGDCPECNDIDFNNNTVFPEDQDVIDFFNVLSGGECGS